MHEECYDKGGSKAVQHSTTVRHATLLHSPDIYYRGTLYAHILLMSSALEIGCNVFEINFGSMCMIYVWHEPRGLVARFG